MRGMLCDTLFDVFGHRICCGRIPEWAARVGHPWRPVGEAPLNLYNVLWRAQEWVRSGMSG